jgi:hypothetical protein
VRSSGELRQIHTAKEIHGGREMEDLEKILVIVKSIFTIIMFVILSFINPIFIYIGGASIIIGGAIVVAFAFISAPISNESEDTE